MSAGSRAAVAGKRMAQPIYPQLRKCAERSGTYASCHGTKSLRSGEGGASQLRPSHTTVRTGPYTAVREVALTRFDQGWETEQFEVGVGKPNTEGFAPCDVPGATAASGRIEQFPRDSQCDQRCTTATWCFPLTPQ